MLSRGNFAYPPFIVPPWDAGLSVRNNSNDVLVVGNMEHLSDEQREEMMRRYHALSMIQVASSALGSHYSGETDGDKSKSKRKRAKFIRKVTCQVCGDVANDHIHYGAIACYSCRAFFRRGVNSNAPYYCSQEKKCPITKHTRKHCQYCRFQKCLTIGMKRGWVMSEEDKIQKRERALIKKLKLQSVQQQKAALKAATRGVLLKTSSSSPPLPSSSCNPHHHDPYSTTSIHSFHEETDETDDIEDPMTSLNDEPDDQSIHSLTHDHHDNTRHHPHHRPHHHHHPHHRRNNNNNNHHHHLHHQQQQHHHQQDIRLTEDENELESPRRYPSPSVSPDLDSSPYHYSSPSTSRLDFSSDSPSLYTANGFADSLIRPRPPSSSSTPSSSSASHLLSPFTREESQLVQNVIYTELEASKMIPLPKETLHTMIECAKSGSAIPYSVCLEGYTICMKRIIRFASQLDFFQDMTQEDQRALLLANTDMIVNIRSARLLRPGINLNKQMSHASGEGGLIRQSIDEGNEDEGNDEGEGREENDKKSEWKTTLTTSNSSQSHKDKIEKDNKDNNKNRDNKDKSTKETSSSRLEYVQVFQTPWACSFEHEQKFHALMKRIFTLEMDQTTTVLMSMMALFTVSNAGLPDPSRAMSNQEFFSQMLYRYLISTIGRANAVSLLPKYMFLLAQLEEMAQIMVTKRLTF